MGKRGPQPKWPLLRRISERGRNIDDEAVMSCGNCGYPMVRGEYDGWWNEERGPYGGWFLKPRFNCCPECGSKVVDWDGRKAVS